LSEKISLSTENVVFIVTYHPSRRHTPTHASRSFTAHAGLFTKPDFSLSVFSLRRPGFPPRDSLYTPSRPRNIHLITCILLCFCSYFILAHRWLVSRRSCRALTCRLVCRNVPPLPAALPAPARTGWRRGTWDMSRSPPAKHPHTAQHTPQIDTRSVSLWTHRNSLAHRQPH
jgi:hypothetical protein